MRWRPAADVAGVRAEANVPSPRPPYSANGVLLDQWGKPLDGGSLDELLRAAPAGSDWWFDGRDLFFKPAGTNLDQVIVPLPETWHESQEVPRAVGYLIAAAVNFLRASRGGW